MKRAKNKRSLVDKGFFHTDINIHAFSKLTKEQKDLVRKWDPHNVNKKHAKLYEEIDNYLAMQILDALKQIKSTAKQYFPANNGLVKTYSDTVHISQPTWTETVKNDS